MRLNKNGFLILPFLLLFCQCDDFGTVITSDKTCLPDVKDKYVYPVIPVEDYPKYKSFEEYRNALCAFPNSALRNISTLGLIRSLLDMPLLSGDYYASSNSSPIIMLDKIYLGYNGTKELFSRKNAGIALIQYYGAVSFDCLGEFDFPVQLAAIEWFISRQEILKQFNHKEKQVLVSLLLFRTSQLENLEIEGRKDSGMSVLAMACVMYEDQYAPIVDYCNSNETILLGYLTSIEQYENILEFANSYIN